MSERVARRPQPLGVTLTATAPKSRSFRPRERGPFLSVRRDGEREIARITLTARRRRLPSRFDRRRPRRRALRLARRRAVRSAARPSLRRLQAARRPLRRRDRPAVPLHPSMFERGVDSGAFAPKAIALAPPPGEPGRLRIRLGETVIYEANLRGFTRLRADVPEAARGTLRRPRASRRHRASARRSASPRSRSCRPTPSSTSAICRRSASPTPGATIRSCSARPIRASRRAAGRRCARRPTRCTPRARGDARHRAQPQRRERRIRPDDLVPRPRQRLLLPPAARRSARATSTTWACGNCLALDRPPVVAHGDRRAEALDDARRRRRLPLRSRDRDRPARLRASTRTRRCSQAIADDPVLSQGQADRRALGHRPRRLPARRAFPKAGANGTTASATPRAASGAATRGMRGELATRLAGSRDVFAQRADAPAKSVNFVVAHDGFTLADLVAYDHKHNEANGEHNRDGSNDNFSWNHGVEGPTDDPAIIAARARDQRNLLALLSSRAARRCWRWAPNSATARAATTTPMRRTTRSPGSTGATPTPR